MREIYYAIYKKSSFKVMVFTSLAEAILLKKASITKDKLLINKASGINFFEKQILRDICINKASVFHLSDYYKWCDFLIKDCVNRGYIKKSWLFGYKKTDLFKEEIQRNLKKGFNQDIRRFIETKNTGCLKNIIKNIDSILIPEFPQKKAYGIYRDRLEILEEVGDATGYIPGI